MKVLVTGGSGIVGHYVIDELLRNGYEVVNADKVRWGNLSHSGTAGAAQAAAVTMRAAWSRLPTFIEVDVTDYGQVISAMDGCGAVVHLAACPSAAYYTEEFVFFTNTTSMWNVMRAAEQLKVRKVVLGSSYNAVGAMGTAARWAPRQVKPPEYFPLDHEVGTRAEDPYSVAKWLGEQTADAFARRNPETQYSNMRFNGMWDDERFRELHRSPVTDPWVRCQGFWTYLHIKDAATACRMAIESEGWAGSEKFFLNADDTMIAVETMEALRLVYPNVPLRKEFVRHEAPISTERARQLINWRPKYSWRDRAFAG